MILFNDVKKVYSDGTQALNHFQLKINEGELMTLIGPSGCGKTTTMKMINRLIEPSSGHLYINEIPIENYNIHELRWNIGYVLQEIALFPHMTIEENIAVVPEMKKWNRSSIRKRTDELMDMTGLDPSVYKKRRPEELSGGEQQRVGVIRALAADPDIILMDEPFSALDPISRQQLQRDIRQIQQEIQKTIVFVTHDMDEALALGDRVCLMKEGQVIQADTPQQLVLSPQTEFVKTFIGERKSPWQTAIDVIADRSGRHTITLTAYENGDFPTKGTYIIYDAADQLAGAAIDGQKVSSVLTLENNMTLDEAVIRLQENQQSIYPVLKDNVLIGTFTYPDVVGFLKRETARKDGVIRS